MLRSPSYAGRELPHSTHSASGETLWLLEPGLETESPTPRRADSQSDHGAIAVFQGLTTPRQTLAEASFARFPRSRLTGARGVRDNNFRDGVAAWPYGLWAAGLVSGFCVQR